MVEEQMDAVKAMAEQGGFDRWIIPGSAESGWYTCVLTGKKMRSKEAADQLERQSKFEESCAQPQTAAAAPAEPEVNEEQPEGEPIDFSKPIDFGTLTHWQHEYLMGNQDRLSPSQANDFAQWRDGMSDKLWVHIHDTPKKVDLVEIKCCDCQTKRMIKPQDVFQVKRCVTCQRKHRNKIRAQRRADKKSPSIVH